MQVTTVPMTLHFLRGAVRAMREAGMEVEAISSPGPHAEEFEASEGVTVHALPMTRRITPGADLVALFRMVRLLRRLRPTLVHAHTPKGGLLGMTGAWLARVPHQVYHLRGLPAETASGPRRSLLRWAEWWSCRLAQRVICVSPSLREAVLDAGLCPAQKLVVLGAGSGQGVDAEARFNPERLPEGTRGRTREEYGIPAHAPVLGFVGRLGREKGVGELARAWTTLRDAHPDLQLLLVGPWEESDPLPADVRESLEGDPRVHRVGEEWDTPPLYAAMDLLALPTYREGFPNVLLEAAAMGLPVVATRVTGCVDAVVDGETGVLVEPRDPEALARAIDDYLRSEALRSDHGRAARDRVLRLFRPERLHRALLTEYRSLIG